MSLIFILQITLLIAALKLYSVKKEPLYSALLYSVPIMVYQLFNGAGILPALVGGSILLAVSFLYFWLQSAIPRGKPTYALIVIGAIVLFYIHTLS